MNTSLFGNQYNINYPINGHYHLNNDIEIPDDNVNQETILFQPEMTAKSVDTYYDKFVKEKKNVTVDPNSDVKKAKIKENVEFPPFRRDMKEETQNFLDLVKFAMEEQAQFVGNNVPDNQSSDLLLYGDSIESPIQTDLMDTTKKESDEDVNMYEETQELSPTINVNDLQTPPPRSLKIIKAPSIKIIDLSPLPPSPLDLLETQFHKFTPLPIDRDQSKIEMNGDIFDTNMIDINPQPAQSHFDINDLLPPNQLEFTIRKRKININEDIVENSNNAIISPKKINTNTIKNRRFKTKINDRTSEKTKQNYILSSLNIFNNINTNNLIFLALKLNSLGIPCGLKDYDTILSEMSKLKLSDAMEIFNDLELTLKEIFVSNPPPLLTQQLNRYNFLRKSVIRESQLNSPVNISNTYQNKTSRQQKKLFIDRTLEIISVNSDFGKIPRDYLCASLGITLNERELRFSLDNSTKLANSLQKLQFTEIFGLFNDLFVELDEMNSEWTTSILKFYRQEKEDLLSLYEGDVEVLSRHFGE